MPYNPQESSSLDLETDVYVPGRPARGVDRGGRRHHSTQQSSINAGRSRSRHERAASSSSRVYSATPMGGGAGSEKTHSRSGSSHRPAHRSAENSTPTSRRRDPSRGAPAGRSRSHRELAAVDDADRTVIEKGQRRVAPRTTSPSALALSHRVDDERGKRRDYSETREAVGCAAANADQRRGGATFRVRVHRCRGAFRESNSTLSREDDSSRGYLTYVVLYNELDRGQTSTAPRSLEPVFNEEFFMHSDNPDRDALVVTLIRRVGGGRDASQRRDSLGSPGPSHQDEKISECTLSLESLVWRQETMIWAPLVHRAGTAEAYEQGEILVSLYSDDYGLDVAYPPEEEAAFFREVHRVLLRYAPQDLHRVHWIVGHYVRDPHRWDRKREKYEKSGGRGHGRIVGPSTRSRSAAAAVGSGAAGSDEGPSYASQRAHRNSRLESASPRSTSARPMAGERSSHKALCDHTARVGGVRLNVLIKEVTGLTDEIGCPLPIQRCCVAISSETGQDENVTTTEVYAHRALFQQDFFITLRDQDERVRLTVLADGGKRVGEAALGLFNLHPKKPQSVMLLLMSSSKYITEPPPTASHMEQYQMQQRRREMDGSAGSEYDNLCITGYVHLIVYTESFSSLVHYGPREAEMLQRRVMAYVWYRCRREMYQLHPILARLQGVELGMRELSATAGPEPLPTHIHLHLAECKHLKGPLAQTGVMCFMEVHLGPFRQRTNSVATRPGGVLRFQETLELVAHEPYTEPCTLLLLVEERNRSVEVGRVTFGFGRMQRGLRMRRAIHLTTTAVSPQATVKGEEVHFELEALGSHGWDPQAFQAAQSNSDEAYYLCRVEGILARHLRTQLHLAPYLVDCTSPGREMELLAHLDSTCGNSVESAPMHVVVLGIKNLQENCKTQVTVKMNGEQILKTHILKKGTHVICDVDDHHDTTVPVYNVMQTLLSFTVVMCGVFGGTTVIGRVEVSLRSLIKGERNTMWIPFFNEEVLCEKGELGSGAHDRHGNPLHIPKNVIPAGFLGIELQSLAFPRTTVVEYPQRQRIALKPQEEVFRDVSTLLLKSKPAELPRVQPLIADFKTMDMAHRELRKQLLPDVIASTLYVTIDEINMYTEEGRKAEHQGNVAVRVRCGERELRTSRQQVERLQGQPPRQFYPIMRVDVPLLCDPNECDPEKSSPGSGSGGPFGTPMPPAGRRPPPSRTLHDGDTGVLPPVPPLVLELIGLKSEGYYDDDPYRPEEHLEEEESAARVLRSTTGDGNANRLQTYQLGGKEHYGQPLPPAPFHRGKLGEVLLSVRFFLCPALYAMGDPVTVPIVATQPESGSSRSFQAVGEVGTVTLRVVSSAFEAHAYPPVLRLDYSGSHLQPGGRGNASDLGGGLHRTGSSTMMDRGCRAPYELRSRSGVTGRSSSAASVQPPPLDPDTIHYYERRIMSQLHHLGASSLVTFHYDLYEDHVASGRWPESLRQWLDSLKIPRLR